MVIVMMMMMMTMMMMMMNNFTRLACMMLPQPQEVDVLTSVLKFSSGKAVPSTQGK